MNKVSKKIEVRTSKTKKVQAVTQHKTAPVCGCGCRATTKGGRFLPGHDAKFHSAMNKAAIQRSSKTAKETKTVKTVKIAKPKPAADEADPEHHQEKLPAAFVVKPNEHYVDPGSESDRIQGFNDGKRGVINSRNAKASVNAYMSGNEDGMAIHRAEEAKQRDMKNKASLAKLRKWQQNKDNAKLECKE